jgi:hypothetical protein
MHNNITYKKIEENIQYWEKKKRDAIFLEDKGRERLCEGNRLGWIQIKFEKQLTSGGGVESPYKGR